MEKIGREEKGVYLKIKEILNPFLLGEIKKTEKGKFEIFNRKKESKGKVKLEGDGGLRTPMDEYDGLLFLWINKGIIIRKIKEQLQL